MLDGARRGSEVDLPALDAETGEVVVAAAGKPRRQLRLLKPALVVLAVTLCAAAGLAVVGDDTERRTTEDHARMTPRSYRPLGTYGQSSYDGVEEVVHRGRTRMTFGVADPELSVGDSLLASVDIDDPGVVVSLLVWFGDG